MPRTKPSAGSASSGRSEQEWGHSRFPSQQETSQTTCRGCKHSKHLMVPRTICGYFLHLQLDAIGVTCNAGPGVMKTPESSEVDAETQAVCQLCLFWTSRAGVGLQQVSVAARNLSDDASRLQGSRVSRIIVVVVVVAGAPATERLLVVVVVAVSKYHY